MAPFGALVDKEGNLELLLGELSVYESKTIDLMSSCEVWYEPLQGGSMGDSVPRIHHCPNCSGMVPDLLWGHREVMLPITEEELHHQQDYLPDCVVGCCLRECCVPVGGFSSVK